MSYYDVLGVAADASAAEVQQAYRARAARLHPDKHFGRGPDEVAFAEREMRRLNEARHVLSDPARRRRYDETLRPGRPIAGHEPVHARIEQPVAGVSGGSTLMLTVPITLLLVALVAIVIFTAFSPGPASDKGGTVRGPSAPGAVVAAVGDCVVVRSGHASEIVPCDEPNDGRVTAEVDRTRPCPHVEERPIDGASGSSRLCLAEFVAR